MKTQLKNKEKVVLIVRKHWFVLVKPFIIVVLLLILSFAADNSEYENYFFFLAVPIILWFIYRILERKNNLWVVTNLRIIDEFGVFSNNAKETPLDKINNVSFHQPLLGRIFNYGDVQIQSAAELGLTVIKMVNKPKKLKDIITQYQELYRQEQIKKQALNLANAVGNQQAYNRISISDELIKLHDLKEKGIITEKEFQARKDKLLKS